MDECNINIALFGEKKSGKSELIKIIGNKNENENENEIKIENENKIYSLTFFEIESEEKIKIEQNNYDNYDVAVMVVDLSTPNSYNSISFWIENIFDNVGVDFIIIVGAKYDKQHNFYNNQKMEKLCKNYENNNIYYVNVSTKTNENIEKLNTIIINKYLHHNKKKIEKFDLEDVEIKKNKKYNVFSNYNTFQKVPEKIKLVNYSKKSKMRNFFEKYFYCCFY